MHITHAKWFHTSISFGTALTQRNNVAFHDLAKRYRSPEKISEAAVEKKEETDAQIGKRGSIPLTTKTKTKPIASIIEVCTETAATMKASLVQELNQTSS